MARRLLVSDGTLAQEAQPLAFKIAVGGVVKQILKASCVENGIVRQFWPPQAGAGDPRIVWTSDALIVIQSVADPIDSFASIIFTRATGGYTFKAYPNADGVGTYLSPALDGTAGDDDKYLIRVDQIGGTALTGTLATWIDLNSAATFTWSLDKTTSGTVGAVANISIAEDNGAGSPVSGTTVVKTVTFSSEVRATSQIIWSTTQYDLVEIKESVDATCDLIFNPSGFATGDADTSGSFNEAWHQDSPNVLVRDIIDRFANQIVDRFGNIVSSRAAEYTVNVTLVSGTAPTGSALGVDLSLDELRQWTLSATSGENLVNALDVTVSDGVTPITKRITMNSQRTEESATPVWTTDEWTLSDVAFPQALALIVDYTITFPVAADATGRVDNASGGGVQETDAWLPGGETAADYEVMLLNTSGADGLISHTSGVWYSLVTQQQFIIQYATVAGLRTREYTASVRKIGDIAVAKVVNIITAGDDGSTPP